MEKKMLLSSHDVLHKKLSKESFGYSIEEVNKFLDVIAKDYEKFEEIEAELMKQIDNCETNIKHLENELRNVSHAKIIAESELSDLKQGGNTDYGTVLKRLAETEVKTNLIEKKLDQIIAALPQDTK